MTHPTDTKEKIAVGAFLAAMHDQGLDGAEVRQAMLEMLGLAAGQQALEQTQVDANPDFYAIPVEYQYHYPDGTWRCLNGDSFNGMKPDRARALYARKDEVLSATHPQATEPAPIGCNYCTSPLYAGTKCKSCGRVNEPAPSTAGEAAPKSTMFHDAGAIAQCGYCQRYTLDRKALSDRQPVCTCGEKYGWSGSFKPPGADAHWHGPAPAAKPSQGELTDEQISEIWEGHVIPVFGKNGINPIVFARKLLAAARSQPTTEESLAVAGAKPLREPLDKCRIELVTAIHMLASGYENNLGKIANDDEAHRVAKGDIAHAMVIAAKWNWNGITKKGAP